MSTLKEKVIIITGASSGIGEAVARELATDGAKIVLAARREDRLIQLQQEIKLKGGEAAYHVTDVSDMKQMDALAQFTLDQYGQIDVLINNAGLMSLSFLYQRKIDEWDRMVDVNIKGVLYGIAAALPSMRERKGGHIINISSVAGHEVSPGGTVYSGTKFAVRAITEGLRKEESVSSNIRATVVSPGVVATELIDQISDEDFKKAAEGLYKVANSPEDIASAVRFAIEQPDSVAMNEILVRPTSQE